MTAHTSEEQLSLCAAGDLDADTSAKIAAHVSGCESCRAQVDQFRDTLRLIASSFTEPSAEDLSTFRAGLLEQLHRPKQRRASWIWALAAATAVLALVLLLPRSEKRAAHVASESLALAPLPQPVVQFATPGLQPAVSRHTRRPQPEAGIRSVALVTRPNQPALIRMTTADPNVVILWQPDTTLKDEE